MHWLDSPQAHFIESNARSIAVLGWVCSGAYLFYTADHLHLYSWAGLIYFTVALILAGTVFGGTLFWLLFGSAAVLEKAFGDSAALAAVVMALWLAIIAAMVSLQFVAAKAVLGYLVGA